MSGNKIGAENLFDSNLFEDVNKGLDAYVEHLREANDGMKDMIKSGRDLVNVLQFDNSASVDKLSKAVTELNVLITQSTRLTAAQAAAEKNLSNAQIAQEKLAQQRIKTQREQQKNDKQAAKDAQALAKEQEKNAKAAKLAESAYNKLSVRLNEQRRAVKDLLASGKELTESDKHLIAQTQELDKRLKEIDRTTGDNHRDVGAYREALNDITAEMGAFGGVITRVARTLKVLQEQSGETNSKLGKLTNVLKAGLIGAALFVVSALLEANKAANAMSEALQAASDKIDIYSTVLGKGADITLAFTKSAMKGFNVSLGEAQEKFAALIDLTIQEGAALRAQSLQLQKLTAEQDEFNQVAGDTTIGYDERIAAQVKSIEKSKEIAELNKNIASGQLNLINAEVAANEAAVGKGNASAELKNKQNEAQIKFNETKSQQDLLEIQNAEKLRQITIDKTLLEIDLILKKKESAHAQKTILEEELKDQHRQLAERRKIAGELLEVNKKTTAEELKIFKDGIGIKFNANKLLDEQDAVILSKKIKALRTAQGHGLGDAAELELAKIIKQYQENKIANTKIQLDLDEEAVKKYQKIAQLTREIELNHIAGQIEAGNKLGTERHNTVEQTNKKIFDTGDVFNKDKINQQRDAHDQEVALALSLTDLKRQQLEAQAENDRQNVRDTVNDHDIQQKEIEKIDKKLQEDLFNSSLDEKAKIRELDQSELDFKKKLADEQRKIIKETADTTINALEDSLKRQDELKNAHIDNDIAIRERNIIQQQQLAEKGYANQLAFEKAQLAKDDLAKEEQKKKEIRRQKAIAFLRLLASYAEKDPDTALSKALVEVAIASAITGSFKDGVEALEGPGTETSDSILARLSAGESVATAKATRNNPGLVTAMNKGKVDEYFKNELLPTYMTETNVNTGSLAHNMANSAVLNQLVGVNDRLKSLEQTIVNKRESYSEIDNLGNVITTDIENGFKKVVIKQRRRPRLG